MDSSYLLHDVEFKEYVTQLVYQMRTNHEGPHQSYLTVVTVALRYLPSTYGNSTTATISFPRHYTHYYHLGLVRLNKPAAGRSSPLFHYHSVRQRSPASPAYLI